MFSGEGEYTCTVCGESIVVPLDPSAGSTQVYTEDCPVCCNPNIVHVEFDRGGEAQIWSTPE